MSERGGIPLGEWSGSAATRELHATIRDFNDRASAQTERMLQLTRTVKHLTWAMLLLVGVQIIVAVVAIIVAG
jgi:hypothetical protein